MSLLLYLILFLASLLPSLLSHWADPRAVELWSFHQALVYILAAVGFVMAIRRLKKQEALDRAWTPLSAPILVFLVVAFVSTCFSFNIFKSMEILCGLVALTFILITALTIFQEKNMARSAVVFILGVGVFLGLMAFWQWIQNSYQMRPDAGFPNPNHLAGYFGLCAILLMPFILEDGSSSENKQLSRRIMLGVLMALYMGGILLTESKGALAAFVAGF